MAVKKSELYSSLWNSCDELRGGMDASLCCSRHTECCCLLSRIETQVIAKP